MGKIWVEVCLISARGLRRTSSMWNLQWFGVGWIDPEDKYCTKIDASGNGNPVWKTKFTTAVDSSESEFRDLALHVEVYSREPIFLRESLLGTATIVLKEFLDKYNAKSEVSKPVEEVGSFQLRKKSSNKPQGFIDISIRISEEREEPGSSFPGGGEVFSLPSPGVGTGPANEYRSSQPERPHQPLTSSHQLQNTHPMPVSPNYSHHLPTGGPSYRAPPPGGVGYYTSYQSPRTPPPPPPPSNVGYFPNFFPGTDNYTPNYISMPSSVARPRPGVGPGFGMGVGAGALAAGAVIFGDDFMSGLDVPPNLRDASLTISLDPPC